MLGHLFFLNRSIKLINSDSTGGCVLCHAAICSGVFLGNLLCNSLLRERLKTAYNISLTAVSQVLLFEVDLGQIHSQCKNIARCSIILYHLCFCLSFLVIQHHSCLLVLKRKDKNLSLSLKYIQINAILEINSSRLSHWYVHVCRLNSSKLYKQIWYFFISRSCIIRKLLICF